MKKYIAPIIAVAMMPMLAAAQNLGNIQTLLQSIGNLVRIATPIVVGLALLGFFWGLAKFIFNAGNGEAKEQGKSIMIWGAVAFFVMLSIFGIVNWIGGNLNIQQGGAPVIPTVPGF